jgi:hypothetical protein
MGEFQSKSTGKIKWLKRIGIIGFIFFLIKGLIWIAILVLTWIGLKG